MKTNLFDNLLLRVSVLVFLILPLTNLAQTSTDEKITIQELEDIINNKTVREKEFAELIILNINSFSSDDLSRLEELLLSIDNYDTGTIGIEFINSGNKELFPIGLELISDLCVSKSGYFQSNTFYDLFIKLGPVAEPYITNIIRNTQNDFCREWACELYCKMFYKLYGDGENLKKLQNINKKERDIYKNLEIFFQDPNKAKKLFEARLSPGNLIRQEWDDSNRYPMRLIGVINYLDNMEPSNHDLIVKKVFEIGSKPRFDFNILNSIYPQEHNSVPVPVELKLRYLAKSVFINGSENTFQWLPKERGGFSKEDLNLAIKKNDEKRINEMERILHHRVCTVLISKLIDGDGNKQINLLRKFHFGTWGKSLRSEDHLLTVHNKRNHGVSLILKKKSDIQNMLTGKNITPTAAEEREEKFYIPPNSKFVWFVPSGDYKIRVNLKKNQINDSFVFRFDAKDFSVTKNMSLDIF